MKSKKFILCLMFMSSMLIYAGCDTTPAERVAAIKATLNQASAINQTIDSSIADVEKVVADSQTIIADPNIPPDMRLEVEQVLAKASTHLAKLKAEKQKASAFIERYQALLDQVDVNNLTVEQELQLYAEGAGEAGKLLPQPYRGYVILVAALVPLLGSIIKNINQARQLKDGRKKITELVISVDSLLESDLVSDPKKAKTLLASKQPTASAAVDAIHGPMKNTGP